MRAPDLGLAFGSSPRGLWNAITDVPGVLVGHCTLIAGTGPLLVGSGPVRTGVTLIRPHGGDLFEEPLYGGFHRLNGNGEFTGVQWLEETGLVTSAIGLTNTMSVGVVRDALARMAAEQRRSRGDEWFLPLVAETWDGVLNDIMGQHVGAQHVRLAWQDSRSGPVPEGGVGGGTGMVCFGFKGGIGTSSRRVTVQGDAWTVGVLVQANHGRRERLSIAGLPAAQAMSLEDLPVPDPLRQGAGSIIVVVATDAPLLPHQCRRLAQRAGLGLARGGAVGEHSSGDLFVAFSTAHRGVLPRVSPRTDSARRRIDALTDEACGDLFDAVVDATEESVLNAMLAGRTTAGRDGNVAHALPHDRLARALSARGR